MKSLEIINQYFELLKIGNVDAVLDFLDDDVIWNVAGVPNVPTVGLLQGKDRVRSEFPERIADWRAIQKSILEEDNLDKLFQEIQSKIFPRVWLDKNPDKAEEERTMMVANGREAMVHAIDAAVINRADVMHLLPKIKAETRIICGGQDQATPPVLSEELANTIPSSHLKILPDIGHHAPIENPDKVTKLIADFIKN